MASPASSNRLRQTERLRKSRDFASVFRRRTKTVADRLLRIHIAPNNLPVIRLGVSVSKRVGHAVTRNAVKRRIREAFRQKKAGLPTGFDMVCVVLPDAADSLAAIAESLNALTTRAFPKREQSRPHGD